MLDSDKNEWPEEIFDVYQFGCTDGDDILFHSENKREDILQKCKQEQGSQLAWDASPQYLFKEQRGMFIFFYSLVTSSLEPTPTWLHPFHLPISSSSPAHKSISVFPPRGSL